MWTEEQTYIAS